MERMYGPKNRSKSFELRKSSVLDTLLWPYNDSARSNHQITRHQCILASAMFSVRPVMLRKVDSFKRFCASGWQSALPSPLAVLPIAVEAFWIARCFHDQRICTYTGLLDHLPGTPSGHTVIYLGFRNNIEVGRGILTKFCVKQSWSYPRRYAESYAKSCKRRSK